MTYVNVAMNGTLNHVCALGTSHQLIAPKPPAQTPMQVPVTLTITGPSGIQTVSALATAGVHQLNLTDSDVTPTSSAVMPTSMATVSGSAHMTTHQQWKHYSYILGASC